MQDNPSQPDERQRKKIARGFAYHVAAAQILANLIGAGISMFYFNFLDTPQMKPYLDEQVLVGALMTLGLVAVGSTFSVKSHRLMAKSFSELSQGITPPPKELHRAQRLVLNAPITAALLSFFIWIFAAAFMSIYLILSAELGSTTTEIFLEAARVFTGVFVAGVGTASTGFFYLDGFYRRRLPVFFPRGGATRISRVFRLPVRWRLFYAFLLVGVGPLLVLGILFYTRLIITLGPTAQTQFPGLLYAVIFVPATMLLTALLLTHLVSESIAGPVETLTKAIGRVARGDLQAKADATGNDELGYLAESFNQMVDELKERERIKETFGRFVSPQIAGRLLAQQPTLGGEMTVVTTLFSDVRNYTTLCEQLSPKQVITMLNGYFKHMVQAVEKNNGLVYQFVGDGIMAVFGAPADLPDHATAAVECAQDMLRALQDFNQERSGQHPPLEIGIGVNTGSVVAGIIGSQQRMEYRVVGDAVNLASRIEELNKDLGTTVLISRTTRDLLTKPFKLTPFDPQPVKGKSQAVQVYAVQPE
jgi:adenylate cyclase